MISVIHRHQAATQPTSPGMPLQAYLSLPHRLISHRTPLREPEIFYQNSLISCIHSQAPHPLRGAAQHFRSHRSHTPADRSRAPCRSLIHHSPSALPLPFCIPGRDPTPHSLMRLSFPRRIYPDIPGACYP